MGARWARTSYESTSMGWVTSPLQRFETQNKGPLGEIRECQPLRQFDTTPSSRTMQLCTRAPLPRGARNVVERVGEWSRNPTDQASGLRSVSAHGERSSEGVN